MNNSDQATTQTVEPAAIIKHTTTVSITFVNRPSGDMIAKLKAGGYRYEAGNWFKSETQGKHADHETVAQLVSAS
jgi:hypothetical protein